MRGHEPDITAARKSRDQIRRSMTATTRNSQGSKRSMTLPVCSSYTMVSVQKNGVRTVLQNCELRLDAPSIARPANEPEVTANAPLDFQVCKVTDAA